MVSQMLDMVATRLNRRKAETVEHISFLSKESLSAGILVSAIFFNAFLAAVNAHVMELSKLDVSLFEASISGMAIVVVALNFRANMLPWLVLFQADLLLHCVLAIANQTFNPVFIRDAIDIPIFIALGMVYSRGNIIRLLFYIQCVVLSVMLVEFAFVHVYSYVFDVLRYYVNTRNYDIHAFWNKGSTLFVSATRPDQRFMFSSFGIHRGSSIFLEPVSLGNYCILATAFTAAFWREMSRLTKLFFVVSTLVILIGSDSRLALVSCIILALGCVIFPVLPRYSNVLYLPGVLLVCGLIVALLGWQPSGDDFSGRLAGGLDFLVNLDANALLGLDPGRSGLGFDSGIGYFIITQSIFGLVALWIFICFAPKYHERRSTIFVHGVCVYISLCLLVSYSLFSIKTAALMWFIYGYLLSDRELLPWYNPESTTGYDQPHLDRPHQRTACLT